MEQKIVIGRIMSPLPDGTIYSAGRTFYLETGVANHDVYPFSSSRRANEEFELQHKSPVFSGTYGDWHTPTELQNRLASATQADVACGTRVTTPTCRAIAQYENYYVLFTIHIYPDVISLDDVAGLLERIDQKMVACLSLTEK